MNGNVDEETFAGQTEAERNSHSVLAVGNSIRPKYVYLSVEATDCGKFRCELVHFTPKRARKVALALLRKADEAEAASA